MLDVRWNIADEGGLTAQGRATDGPGEARGETERTLSPSRCTHLANKSSRAQLPGLPCVKRARFQPEGKQEADAYAAVDFRFVDGRPRSRRRRLLDQGARDSFEPDDGD